MSNLRQFFKNRSIIFVNEELFYSTVFLATAVVRLRIYLQSVPKDIWILQSWNDFRRGHLRLKFKNKIQFC